MDQPPTPLPTILPLARATAAQLAQALLAVRDALSVYYPAITLEQWQEAIEQLGCPLYVTAQGITATATALRDLIDHFEKRPQPSGPPAAPNGIPALLVEWGALRKTKKTYELLPDVLEALDRASFWGRVGKSYLVNLSLTRLLADIPESRAPIPPHKF